MRGSNQVWRRLEGVFSCGVCNSGNHSTIIHGFWMWCYCWYIVQCPMTPPYWRTHWHLWRILRINGRWHLKVYWCTTPRILFFTGTIPQSYSKDMGTLSSLWVLRHQSYRIFHRHWQIPFHGIRHTRRSFRWNCLGASEDDWRPCWRLASWFDNMSMWMTVIYPPVWSSSVTLGNGVVPTAVKPDCHPWVLWTSLSWYSIH